MRKKIAIITGIILVVYVVSYLGFRFTHTEIWTQTNDAYVIFPKRPIALYYFFRPLSYLDQILTGMKFHIGSHQA